MMITTIASKPVARPVCQAWFSVLYRCSLSPLYRGRGNWAPGGEVFVQLWESGCDRRQPGPGHASSPPAPNPPSSKTRKWALCGMLRAVGGTPVPAGQGGRAQTPAGLAGEGGTGLLGDLVSGVATAED